MRFPKFAISVVAASSFVGIATTGCGSLDDRLDQPSTLLTLHGQVVNPTNAPVAGGDFRVALVWSSVAAAAGGGRSLPEFHTAEDVAVSAAFPVQFDLSLTELPATDVLSPATKFGFTVPSDVRIGNGSVVAYDDKNHNGKLDLVGPSAATFVDSILGTSPTIILYAEGSVSENSQFYNQPFDSNHQLTTIPNRGYNLLVDDCDNSNAETRANRVCTYAWQAPTAAISIYMNSDPQFSSMMCQTFSDDVTFTYSNDTTHPAGQFPASFPASTDPSVSCGHNGDSYRYVRGCTTVRTGGLCGAKSTTCEAVDFYSLVSGATLPGGWPCKVNGVH